MKKSVKYGFVLKHDGSHCGIDLESIQDWQPQQGIVWLHLDFTSKKAMTWLRKRSGIDKSIVRSMIAEESRPRHIQGEKGSFLALRGVNNNPGQEIEDMTSLRVWVDSDRLITLSRRNLTSIDDIAKEVKSGTTKASTSEIFTKLLNFVTNRISDAVENLNDTVELLEDEVIVNEKPDLRSKLTESRRDIIMIRRYLAPQREALHRFSIETSGCLDHEGKQYIREAIDRTIRYIETLDLLKEQIAISQDELSSRLSEVLNQRMYRLSMVATVFLPLSFVTGLLGINVGGIPYADNKHGFNIIVFLLFSCSILTFYYLRRKEWL